MYLFYSEILLILRRSSHLGRSLSRKDKEQERQYLEMTPRVLLLPIASDENMMDDVVDELNLLTSVHVQGNNTLDNVLTGA